MVSKNHRHGRAYYTLDDRDFAPGSPDYPDASRNVLPFWIYGNFLTSGQLPYLALPALGYDQRQKTGRGYTFGRFRGEDLLYQESEYRFPLTGPTGRLGGVLFVNFTSQKTANAHSDGRRHRTTCADRKR